MKKTELKKILKPLITECIKEVMFEDGVLSGIISEVARGMAATAIVGSPANTKATTPDPAMERMRRNAFSKEQSSRLQEQKSKLMAAIGGRAYNDVNLFEGTTPGATESSPAQQASALAGVTSGDAGVDISNLFGAVGNNWNAHMTSVKEEK